MYNRVIIPLLILFSSFGAIADTTAKKPLQLVWPFEGIFGTFDRQAAQRGAQVYLEVCSTCHSNTIET
jgi:ubiquinol-cytochrome c reductase cytochrome c1 subunit